MSSTGDVLERGLSRFIGDHWGSATTSAGNAGGTTVVDTALQRMGDDGWRDYFVRLTSGSATLEIRKITDFTSSSGTVTVLPAFSAQVASGVTYQLHRYDPATKFKCLDDARIRAYPDLGIMRFIDTLTSDGISTAWDIPSTVRRGPLQVLEEDPVSVQTEWNFLSNPFGNTTTDWTASSATATIVTRIGGDWQIPKYDDQATRVAVATATNGTYSQAVADMTNDATAALVAGRQVTFAAWVFCRTASRVSLKLVDDSTTTTGTAHGGAGWELLTVTATMPTTNATTFTARFDVTNASGAIVYWWNRAWLYFGAADRVQNVYRYGVNKRIRRDDTTQKFYLEAPIARGRQMRLMGRDTLSALGTTAATQVTNTMEVDEEAAQVLYAEAARILFEREGINTSDLPDVSARLQFADRLRKENKQWKMQQPAGRAIVGMWAR